MTRLERELLTRIKARLDALDPGAAEKLAVLLPVLRRFAQSYAALGPAAKKTIEALLPELAGIPTIVVSAKTAVQDRVGLLLGGAVDYLTKPFDTQELLARVAVRLRERASSPLAPAYACGDLTLDTVSHAVTAAGKPVALTRTEYAILKLLMQNPGQVLAKSVLLERIAADTPDCTESSLKTHVSHLRTKLRAAADRDYLEAVWGIGFRLRV